MRAGWLGGAAFWKVLGLCLALGACSLKSTVDYQEPSPEGVKNLRELDRPFEETWGSLVENLSNGFFVVQDVEKETGNINVVFETADPGRYIDCGNSTRDYVSLTGRTERTQYRVADDSTYRVDRTHGHTMTVTRKTALAGRANVHLVPTGKRTTMTVDIKYVFNVDATYQTYNIQKVPLGTPATKRFVTQFDTNRPAAAAPNSGGVSCFSKGVIEQGIFEAAAAEPAPRRARPPESGR